MILSISEATDALNEAVTHFIDAASDPIDRATICSDILSIDEMRDAGISESAIDDAITHLVRQAVIQETNGTLRRTPTNTNIASILSRLSDARRTDPPPGGQSTASTSPPSPAPTGAASNRLPPVSAPDDTTLSNQLGKCKPADGGGSSSIAPTNASTLVSLLGKRKSGAEHRQDANNEAMIFAERLHTTLQNTIAAAVVSSQCPAYVAQGQALAELVRPSFDTTASELEALPQQSFEEHQKSLSEAESRISALARNLVSLGIDLDNTSPPSNLPYDPNKKSAHHVCPFCCVSTATIDQASDAGRHYGRNYARWERHLSVCPHFPGENIPLPHESETTLAAPLQLQSKRARRETDSEAQNLLRLQKQSDLALVDLVDDNYGSLLWLYSHNYSSALPVVKRAVDVALRARQNYERYVTDTPVAFLSHDALLTLRNVVLDEASFNAASRASDNPSPPAASPPSASSSAPSRSTQLSAKSDTAASRTAATSPHRLIVPAASPSPRHQPVSAARPQPAHNRQVLAGYPAPSGNATNVSLPPGTSLTRTGTATEALLYMLYVNPLGLDRLDMQRQAGNLNLKESTTTINGRIEGLLRNGWAQLHGPGIFTMTPLARAYFATEDRHSFTFNSDRQTLEKTLRAGSLAYRDSMPNAAASPKQPAGGVMPPPPGPPPPLTPANPRTDHAPRALTPPHELSDLRLILRSRELRANLGQHPHKRHSPPPTNFRPPRSDTADSMLDARSSAPSSLRTTPDVNRHASSAANSSSHDPAPSLLHANNRLQQLILGVALEHRQNGPYGCPRRELTGQIYRALINQPTPGHPLSVGSVKGQIDVLTRDNRLRSWHTPDGTGLYGLAPYGGVGCPPLPKATISHNEKITDGEIARALYQILEDTFDSPQYNNAGLEASEILVQARNLVGQHVQRTDLDRVLLHALADQSISNLSAGGSLKRYAPFGAHPDDGPSQRLRGTRGEEHVGIIQADQGTTGWKRQCATCNCFITWSRAQDAATQFAHHILQSAEHLEGPSRTYGSQPPAGPASIARAVFTAISSLTVGEDQATQANLVNVVTHARTALGEVHCTGVETAIALLLDEPSIVRASIHEGRQLYAPTPPPEAPRAARHTITQQAALPQCPGCLRETYKCTCGHRRPRSRSPPPPQASREQNQRYGGAPSTPTTNKRQHQRHAPRSSRSTGQPARSAPLDLLTVLRNLGTHALTHLRGTRLTGAIVALRIPLAAAVSTHQDVTPPPWLHTSAHVLASSIVVAVALLITIMKVLFPPDPPPEIPPGWRLVESGPPEPVGTGRLLQQEMQLVYFGGEDGAGEPPPIVRMSFDTRQLSALNSEIVEAVKFLSRSEVIEYELPDPGEGNKWAVLDLITGETTTLNLPVRISMSDAFDENTLSVIHALARDITVNTYTTPPTIRSNRRTFQLQRALYGEGNEQGLFLTLPLQLGIDGLMDIRNGKFGPSNYGADERTAQSVGASNVLMEAAGTSHAEMLTWTQSHALPCGRPPVWLLAAFGHLRRLQDAPTLDTAVEALNAPQPRPIAHPHSNRVSSMARTFRMPTVCVSIRLPNDAPTMITAIAVKDTLANCCMMSSTCAVRLGLDLDSLEPYDGVIIHERFRSAGGPLLRSEREHYTTYKAIGSVRLEINLPRTSPFSWDDNKVMVYEDRSLPRGTRYDFIIYNKLIDLLPPQRRKARYNAPKNTHSAGTEVPMRASAPPWIPIVALP